MTDEARRSIWKMRSARGFFLNRNFSVSLSLTWKMTFRKQECRVGAEDCSVPTIYDVRSFTKDTLISGIMLLSDLLTIYESETGLEGQQRREIAAGRNEKTRVVKLNYLLSHDKPPSPFNCVIKSITISA